MAKTITLNVSYLFLPPVNLYGIKLSNIYASFQQLKNILILFGKLLLGGLSRTGLYGFQDVFRVPFYGSLMTSSSNSIFMAGKIKAKSFS
jgi:hypothetical protein